MAQIKHFDGSIMKLDFVHISDIGQHLGKEVILKGWLYKKRSSGKIHFLQIRDGTGVIQGVMVKNEVGEEIFARGDRVTQESSIIVRGLVKEDQRAPSGYELGVTGLQIVQLTQDYPITPKEHGPAFLMEHRHLWMRSSKR
jgi:asparaginyl-tRNA synthetase